MIYPMGTVIDLLERPTYSFGQVDGLLRLSREQRSAGSMATTAPGSATPVIREATTTDPFVTWGEFVEARLLSEFRQAGVPMLHLRPVVDELRQRFGVRYPLASARLWLEPAGRRPGVQNPRCS